MPITLTCSGCGKSYQLKDELAGKRVRCPGCQTVQVVPGSPDGYEAAGLEGGDASASPDGLAPAFNRDRFLLRQKLMTVGSKYVVSDEQQRPILYIERPLHFWRSLLAALAAAVCFIIGLVVSLVIGLGVGQALHNDVVGGVLVVVLIFASIVLTFMVGVALSARRHIEFYADETRREPLLRVLQDKKFFVINATYTVLTPAGELLGRMKKNYLYNIFRKKWEVFGPDGRMILLAREDSLILSLLRRFLGPFFGLLRTNFILLTPGEGGEERIRGEFNRKFTIFDRYVLDVSRDRPRTIDRRLAVALGVLLDTGEHR